MPACRERGRVKSEICESRFLQRGLNTTVSPRCIFTCLSQHFLLFPERCGSGEVRNRSSHVPEAVCFDKIQPLLPKVSRSLQPPKARQGARETGHEKLSLRPITSSSKSTVLIQPEQIPTGSFLLRRLSQRYGSL